MDLKNSQVSQWFDLYMPSKSDVVERTLTLKSKALGFKFFLHHY